MAGIFQAAALVYDMATRGGCDETALACSTESIFMLDADDVPAVFGGVAGIELGLRTLARQLAPRDPSRNLELTRYVIALLALEINLDKDAERMSEIGTRIASIGKRRSDFALGFQTVANQLAELYQELVSPVMPRIMVRGETLHLQNPDNAARIRTALLAGIRAAHLWRQCGGNRWRIIFTRSRLVASAENWLKTLEDSSRED